MEFGRLKVQEASSSRTASTIFLLCVFAALRETFWRIASLREAIVFARFDSKTWGRVPVPYRSTFLDLVTLRKHGCRRAAVPSSQVMAIRDGRLESGGPSFRLASRTGYRYNGSRWQSARAGSAREKSLEMVSVRIEKGGRR